MFAASSAVPCTACGYCLEGCPKGIRIPQVFDALNLHLVSGRTEEGRQAYGNATADAGPASACIGCKKCEAVCPQHIGITDALEQAASLYES